MNKNEITLPSRPLGRSELRLTRIGLGTWAMGGDGWAFAWGPQDDGASLKAIHRALDCGINWIDTAAVYGLGHAEEIVGQAIKERRKDLVVATKCGRVWDPATRQIGKRLTAKSVKDEAEASLRRLNLDVIDLYQIHWPEPDEEIEEGWDAVADLIRAGKVRYGGVSNFNLAQLKRAQAIHPVTSLQPPYSMLNRAVEPDLLPYCREQGIGVVVYSPMQAGLLTGKYNQERVAALPATDWRRRSPYFQEPALSLNLQFVEGLRALARRHGMTVAQLALAWVLRRPEVTAAIVGARRPDQIEETVQAAAIELLPEDVAQIERLLEEREQGLEAAQGS
jgi:aryl-alcohol dehydrogenase-like predicted oxidoreductase